MPIDKKVSTAVNVLTSWLSASKIPHTLQYPKILLQNKCQIEIVDSPRPPQQNRIFVCAESITHYRLDVALPAFQEATSQPGYGRPVPVNRPMVWKGRPGRHKENWELSAMRWTEFVCAPDPDPEEFAKYATIGRSLSKRFYVTNKILCDYWGYGVDDIETYTKVWIIGFLHKYRLSQRSEVENRKLCNVHLQQHLAHLRSTIAGKMRNSSSVGGCSESTVEVFHRTATGYEILDVPNKKKRRKAAKAMLAQKLSEMPHDKMVETLQYYSRCEQSDPQSQSLAAKLLRNHCRECAKCQKNNVPGWTGGACKKRW